jgi:hypothetical protein
VAQLAKKMDLELTACATTRTPCSIEVAQADGYRNVLPCGFQPLDKRLDNGLFDEVVSIA